MKRFHAVVYEHLRYEVDIDAEDEKDARIKLDLMETDDMVRDNEYYERETMALEEGQPLTPSRGERVRCQNCVWEGDEADCDPIADLHQRVAAGEPMPAGQCPECGALCQLKEPA